jgi:hypothetical protein
MTREARTAFCRCAFLILAVFIFTSAIRRHLRKAGYPPPNSSPPASRSALVKRPSSMACNGTPGRKARVDMDIDAGVRFLRIVRDVLHGLQPARRRSDVPDIRGALRPATATGR